MKLDPFHASAELGLAEVAQHADNIDSAMAHLNRFRTITSEDLGRPIGDAYGEQGKYSRAQELPRDTEQGLPASEFALPMSQRTPGCPFRRPRPPAAFARVVNRKVPVRTVKKARGRGRLESRARSPAFSAAARVSSTYDGDGKPDIFLVNADGREMQRSIRNNGNGKFVNVTKAAGWISRSRNRLRRGRL